MNQQKKRYSQRATEVAFLGKTLSQLPKPPTWWVTSPNYRYYALNQKVIAVRGVKFRTQRTKSVALLTENGGVFSIVNQPMGDLLIQMGLHQIGVPENKTNDETAETRKYCGFNFVSQK